jgi:hypothetical protein
MFLSISQMLYCTTFLSFLFFFSTSVPASDAAYILQDDYNIANFFDMFTFYTVSRLVTSDFLLDILTDQRALILQTGTSNM